MGADWSGEAQHGRSLGFAGGGSENAPCAPSLRKMREKRLNGRRGISVSGAKNKTSTPCSTTVNTRMTTGTSVPEVRVRTGYGGKYVLFKRKQ